MAKIGRNEPCPCGSGKKYKQCCLDNKVIDISTKMATQELERLNEDLEEFALQYTDPIYSLYKAYVSENNWDIDSDYEEEYYLLFVGWAIFNAPLIDGETIFQTFMDEQSGALRPETKERIDGWVTVPGMYEVIDHIDDDHFKVVSLETGERNVFCDKEDELPEIGNGVIGIFVPFTNNVNHFLFTYDEFPLELLQSVYEQYRSDLDLARFSKAMKHEYPFILHDLFNDEADPRELIDTYEWASKKHQAVIELLYETNRPIWDDEDLNLAIEVWQEYCEDENPIVKKEAVFAAALEYLVNMMDGDGATQKEIAEKYRVSPNSVSQRYQEMNYLMFDYFNEAMEDHLPFDPDMADPSAFAEQMFGELKEALESQEFSSEEDVEQFMNELMETDLPFGKQPGTSEATGAQADRYVTLAEQADTLEEQNDLYFDGMIKGEAELGPGFFENNRGLFWGLTETRPYMLAKQGYAETCEHLGALDLAIEHYRELLDLNETDNQGIRYLLLGALMKAGDYEEAKELMDNFDEPTANMVYNRAYAEYKLNGWTKKTEKSLKAAVDQNPHVPAYLLGKRKIPETIPPFYGLGDENEAIDYAQRYAELWQEDQALLQKLEALV